MTRLADTCARIQLPAPTGTNVLGDSPSGETDGFASPMASKTEQLQAAYDAHGEKLRFLVVGGWNTLVGYALFAIALWAFEPLLAPLAASDQRVVAWIGEHYYLLVQWLVWVVAVVHSTLMLKWFAFRSKGHWLSEIGRAYLVYLPMQGVSSFLLWLFSGVLGIPPLLGQLLTVGISAVLSYLGHKNFTFKDTTERS